jgi:hypothetical protein
MKTCKKRLNKGRSWLFGRTNKTNCAILCNEMLYSTEKYQPRATYRNMGITNILLSKRRKTQ